MALKFYWLTDIHLNFLDEWQLEKFITRLASKKSDGLLIAGDIGEADSLIAYLKLLAERVDCHIYFVLGNHDYYGGSIDYVRSELIDFIKQVPRLHWLSVNTSISLSSETALVGHDSWADGRLGDYWNSRVQLNDFLQIGDFIGRTESDCLNRMQVLADEAVQHLQKNLNIALQNHSKVIVMTHVPPFAESALYRGKISDAAWLPFFTCQAVGETLLRVMAKHPDKEALVLCGHTHGSAVYQALPNLRVVTGAALYGQPRIYKALEIC